MATPLLLNGLLTLPPGYSKTFELGKEYVITKPGFRIMPFETPLELADDDFHYIGKVIVTKLVVTQEETEVTFTLIKLFSPEDAAVFDRNFIKK